MGRPPIGKRAMTGAERQRRRRARLAEQARNERGTQPSADTAAKLAHAQARIAQLEAERDRYKQMAESGGKDGIAELEAKRHAKLRKKEPERRAKSKARREAQSAALRKAAADRKAKRAAAETAR